MPRKVVVAAAFALLFPAVLVHAQRLGAIDWIFLVDTSKSMRTNRVFDDVRASLGTFVREADDGDSIAVLTFDRDVRTHAVVDVRDASSRQDLLAIVDNLEPTGDRTHLGLAIAKGIERAETLSKRSDRDSRTRAVVLFTDGKEDVRGIADAVPIPATFARALASGASMFFVSMKEHEAQLRNFPNGTFIEAADPAAIRNVSETIRKRLPPRRKPPPPLAIEVVPAMLDFGEIERGETSIERELTITANRRTTVSVRLAPSAGITMQPQDKVPVAPDAPARLKLKIAVGDDAAPGARELQVIVSRVAAPVTASVTVLKPSLLAQLAKWLVAAALLAIAIVIARARLRERNRLEGELEIVQPNVATDAAFVGLPALGTSEVALSSIVPRDALSGSDARLYVRHKAGAKKVWIAAQSGTLRVNDIEVPATELYDADTIQIGAAKLRFNRLGHERPQEDPS